MALHRNGLSHSQRPARRRDTGEVPFGTYFGKDPLLSGAFEPAEAALSETAEENILSADDTDRLLKQTQDQVARLRQVIENRLQDPNQEAR